MRFVMTSKMWVARCNHRSMSVIPFDKHEVKIDDRKNFCGAARLNFLIQN